MQAHEIISAMYDRQPLVIGVVIPILRRDTLSPTESWGRVGITFRVLHNQIGIICLAASTQ